jgi:hypothetical protein
VDHRNISPKVITHYPRAKIAYGDDRISACIGLAHPTLSEESMIQPLHWAAERQKSWMLYVLMLGNYQRNAWSLKCKPLPAAGMDYVDAGRRRYVS